MKAITEREAKRRAKGFWQIVEIKFQQHPALGVSHAIQEAFYEHQVACGYVKTEGME